MRFRISVLSVLCLSTVVFAREPRQRTARDSSEPQSASPRAEGESPSANEAITREQTRNATTDSDETSRLKRKIQIPHEPIPIELAAGEIINTLRRGSTSPMLFLLKAPVRRPKNNDEIASAINILGQRYLPQMWPARFAFLQRGPLPVRPLVQPGRRPDSEPLQKEECEHLFADTRAWAVLEIDFVEQSGHNLVMFRFHTRQPGVSEIGTNLELTAASRNQMTPAAQ